MTKDFNPWEMFQGEFMNKKADTHSQNGFANHDFSWIEDYVQGILTQALPEQMKDFQKKKPHLKHEVFEAHHYMITKVVLPESVEPEKVKVYVNTNEVKIEEDEGSFSKVIKLPANSIYKGSKAIIQNNILEVRIPKRMNDTFQEIPVQF